MRDSDLYEKILKEKIDYYGETKAAYHFAADEYERQCNVELLEKIKFLQQKVNFYEK